MSSFFKFINKKKVQNHFKKSGEGIRLDSGASSSSSQPSSTSGSDKGTKIDRAAAADLAAQAALNRIQKNEPQDASKRKIQMIAKRELEKEEENRKKLEQLNIIDPKKPQMDVKELEHSSVITKVLYSCELLGDDIIKTKSELSKDIEVFLNEQIDTSDDEHDKLIAAVLMIYSLNKTSTRQTAVETIGKYIQNILEHPGEAKYRSIRIGNKAFQERVQGAIGGKRFLEAVGFIEKKDGEESFFVFSKDSDVHLVEALEVLRNGQAVPIKFARNLEVFVIKEGQKVAAPKLADDFFNLTAEEIKKEQKAREEQVEQMLTLRTKEMKQKDEKLSNYKYKYTLIRVRLPGNLLLQGVFSCYEKFEAIREFIASTLDESVASVLFSLRDAAGKKFDDESLTLAHYGLAPAAVLHLDFAESIDRDVVIKNELIENIQQL